MEGLLLKLLEDGTGRPGVWFWKLFAPIRQDLDRLFWCFGWQPWLGAPPGFGEAEMEPFAGVETSSAMLWRPGALSRYASRFAEEEINLWGIEPTQDEPSWVVAQYCASRKGEEIIRQYARIWLLYTDSTCWEIFVRKTVLLDRVREGLDGKPWVKIYQSHSDQRGWAFGMAGLSEIWHNLK